MENEIEQAIGKLLGESYGNDVTVTALNMLKVVRQVRPYIAKMEADDVGTAISPYIIGDRIDAVIAEAESVGLE